jgi:hypothetical protein
LEHGKQLSGLPCLLSGCIAGQYRKGRYSTFSNLLYKYRKL